LTVLDISDYESARLIHDLNRPVPAELHERFDVVIEAGSLEHIFNFPVAVGNLMRMLKVGGFMYLTVPANNLCGHGFYQFSPELMFRVFTPDNGFELKGVKIAQARFPGTELAPVRRVYEVADPVRVGSRVGLLSSRPAMLMVEACKTSGVEPFRPPPQQSDYVAAWARKGAAAATKASPARRLWRVLPVALRNRLIAYRNRRACLLSNKKNYRRLS
jgi:SAM-dependent methyltransferase